jgi:hypothetical protein
VKADVYMKVGELINPVQVDADRRGFVIAIADDPLTALGLADQATAKLTVEVADGSRQEPTTSSFQSS